MTRTMYDSVTPEAIPKDAQMVAGYIDGNPSHVWSNSDWNLFPSAVKVRIARVPETNDGHVLDVEMNIAGGEWPPGPRMVSWVERRRQSGMVPTVYCNQLNDWPTVRQQFHSRGVEEPLYWVARYNNIPVIPTGAIAKQYAHPPQLGFNADASVVEDYWPGVDGGRLFMTLSPQEEQEILQGVRLIRNVIQAPSEWTVKDWSLGRVLSDMRTHDIGLGSSNNLHEKVDNLETVVEEIKSLLTQLLGSGVTLTAEGQIVVKGS